MHWMEGDFSGLFTQGLEKGDEHPAYTSLGVLNLSLASPWTSASRELR